MLRYVLMFCIVVGLALSDFVTGFIKACVTNSVESSKMRKGGLNKLSELVVMATACGLEVGVEMLGRNSGGEELAKVTGLVCDSAIFGYIAFMEVISILENYAAINPQANGWISKLIKRLKSKEE
ncbi:MAG: phage holin family protein [Oscillospiraceae bacterium]|nr:phage holin family protein [Oscillospiraceae bacterium]